MSDVIDLDLSSEKTGKLGVTSEETCEMIMEQAFYSDDRTMIMFDGKVLHEMATALNFDINYAQLPKLFKDYSHVQQLIYYNDVPADAGHHPQIPLMKWLSCNGYVVSEAINYERNSHINVAVRMATDMVMLAANRNVNHFVLFASHSALAFPVRQLIRMGMRVTVVGLLGKTAEEKFTQTSMQLRQDASQFIDLRHLIEQIAR